MKKKIKKTAFRFDILPFDLTHKTITADTCTKKGSKYTVKGATVIDADGNEVKVRYSKSKKKSDIKIKGYSGKNKTSLSVNGINNFIGEGHLLLTD